MQIFRKSFREPVGQGFRDDGAVIVVLGFKFLRKLISAVNRDRKSAEIIVLIRRNIISQAMIELPGRFLHLLSQKTKARARFRKISIVAVAARRPEAKHAARS